MTEEVATFGPSQSLVGIMTKPSLTTQNSLCHGLIILGAGLLPRSGPNRTSVKIARFLAQLGITTLRFDFSGVGDSLVRKDHLPHHKSVILETQDAIDFFQSSSEIQRYILLGICTGAMNSFEIARRDPRVRGIILINPAGGFDRTSSSELARYFRKKKPALSLTKGNIVNPKNWWRALTGKMNYTNLLNGLLFWGRQLFLRQDKLLPHTERAFDTLYQLVQQGVNILFVISERDPNVTNNFGALLKDKLSKPPLAGKVSMAVIKQADHTFTSLSSQPQLFRVIQNFVLKCSTIGKPIVQIQDKAISVHPGEANFQTKNTVTSPGVYER